MKRAAQRLPLRLSDYLSEHSILLDLDTESKIDAFRALVTCMANQNLVQKPNAFLDEVIERESIQPTCVGRGVAFPHARTICVDRPVIAFARTTRRIRFTQAQNDDDVQLIFMMGTPKDAPNVYLQILAKLCTLLRRAEFRQKLLAANNSEEIVQLFTQCEMSEEYN